MKLVKRRGRPRIAASRRELANLAHTNRTNGGWTQAAIAQHLQIPQGTVSRGLAAVGEFWREFSAFDFEIVGCVGLLL